VAAGQYGEEWTRGVIDGWFRSEHYFETDRYQWVERLPGLCGVLRTCGVPKTHTPPLSWYFLSL